MTLKVLLNWAQGQFDGLESPGYPNAKASVASPNVVDAGAIPQLFLWSSDIVEVRRALPRAPVGGTGGGKTATHSVDIWMIRMAPSDAKRRDDQFLGLVDAVMDKARSLQLPVTLTDPDTGDQSFLTHFGENIRSRIDLVRSVGAPAGSLVRYLALVTTEAIEVWNG